MFAAPPVVEAQYSYTIVNGTITISGYTGPGGAVAIPKTIDSLPVTVIGGFAEHMTVTSVSIPDSVTTIFTEAFYGCSNLSSVTIGTNVTTIGGGAFSECASLTSINIPNSVTSIGPSTFAFCRSLTSVTIGESVTSIGLDAFYSCPSLSNVNIPDSVTSIGYTAFALCTSLTSITIGNSLTSIEWGMFNNCTNLTSVVIPNSVANIEHDVFYRCFSLTNLTIPNSVTNIGAYAFYFCTNLTSVVIPNSVTSVGGTAFLACQNLTSVTIGESVTSIGAGAFQECYSLTNVCFAGNAPSDGGSIFSQDHNLSTICHMNGATGWGPTFSGVNSASCTQCEPSPSDLAVTFLGVDPQRGGLSLSYTNQGGPLPAQTIAKLFWAIGPTTNDIITNVSPIFTTNIPSGFTGQATNYVPESLLNFPPTNATRFLLVLDPGNLIIESTKTNNTAVLTNTFRHIVLVMMENRSFDHLLGWLGPVANGKQEGLSFTNASGQSFSTWHLAPYFQGCGCNLPDQTFGAPQIYNNGAWNGWLLANPSDTYTIGYYTQNDLPFFGTVATNWTVCDNYHAALLAETQPNRIYQHAAQTDALQNRTGLGVLNFVKLPTIWDELKQSNISGRYYYSPQNAPVPGIFGSMLSLWGTRYLDISFTVPQFYNDCFNGNLPAVSFVDPLFTAVRDGFGLGDTVGNDDHPHSDIRNGEVFLSEVFNSVVRSPQWSSTVLIINFDEWGGFYDHENPPPYPPAWNGDVPPADNGAYSNAGISPANVAYGRLGFRVPCIVISPWSRNGSSQKGIVSAELFDHTSVLTMIELRWMLASLTIRDATANDLSDVLDLDHPNFEAPAPLLDPRLTPFYNYGGQCQTLQPSEQPNGDIVVSWDATCLNVVVQTAPHIYGPWSDLFNVSISPYILTKAAQMRSSEGYVRFRLVPR
jgi:phospholipase C